MPHHSAVIHVLLNEPLPIKGKSGLVVGYYQSLGVTSEPANLRVLIERHVRDGTVDWPDSDVEVVDSASLDENIQGQIVPVSGEGVWYESGRSFHGPE